MISRAPTGRIWTEAMRVVTVAVSTITAIVAAAPEKWRTEGAPRGIEAPTKGAVEDSVPRHECIRIKPRIPIPTVAIPAGTTIGVCRRVIGVSFRRYEERKLSSDTDPLLLLPFCRICVL